MKKSPFDKTSADFNKPISPSEAEKAAHVIADKQELNEAEIRKFTTDLSSDFIIINDITLQGAAVEGINIQTNADVFVAETLRTKAPTVQSQGTGVDMVSISISFPNGDAQQLYLRRIIAEISKHPFIFIENSKIRQAIGYSTKTMIFALHSASIRSGVGKVGVIYLDLQLVIFNYKPFSNHYWYNAILPGSQKEETQKVFGELLPGQPLGRDAFDFNAYKFASNFNLELTKNSYEVNTPVVYPAASGAWMYYANHLESNTPPLGPENKDFVAFQVRQYRIFNPPEGSRLGEGSAPKIFGVHGRDKSAPQIYLADNASSSTSSDDLSFGEQKSKDIFKAYSDNTNLKSAVYKGPKRTLQVRNEELLWIARGVYGEGGAKCSREKASALLWAIMNRCLIGGGRSNNKASYGWMWKNFSQPIKEIWLRNGSMCKPGGKYYGTEYCNEERLKRRDNIARLQWKNIPKTIRQYVLDFQAGKLPYPNKLKKNISNWASYKNVDKKYPNGQWINGDWFIVDDGVLDTPVQVISPQESTPVSEQAKKDTYLSTEDIWDIPFQSIPEENKETTKEEQSVFNSSVSTSDSLLEKQNLTAREQWIQNVEDLSPDPDFTRWNYYYNDNGVRNVFFRDTYMYINGGSYPEPNIVCTALSINFGHRLAQQKLIGQPSPSWQFLGAGNKSGTFVFEAAGIEGLSSLTRLRDFYQIAQENARLFKYIPDAGCIGVYWEDLENKDNINNLLALSNTSQIVITDINDNSNGTKAKDMYSVVLDWIAYEPFKKQLLQRDVVSLNTKFAMLRKIIEYIKWWSYTKKDPEYNESWIDSAYEGLKKISAYAHAGPQNGLASPMMATNNILERREQSDEFIKYAAIDKWMATRAKNHFIGPKSNVMQWSKDNNWTPVGEYKNISWFTNLITETVKVLTDFKDKFPDLDIKDTSDNTNSITWERRLSNELGSNIVGILNGTSEPIGTSGLVSKGFWYDPEERNRRIRIATYYSTLTDNLNQISIKAMNFINDDLNFIKIFGEEIYNAILASVISQLGECYSDLELPSIPGQDYVPLPPEFFIYDDAMENAVLSETNEASNLEKMIESHIENEAKSIYEYTSKLLLAGKNISYNFWKVRDNKINLNEKLGAEYGFLAFSNLSDGASGTLSRRGFQNAMLAEGIKIWDSVITDTFFGDKASKIRDKIFKQYETSIDPSLSPAQKRIDGFLNMAIQWSPHLEYWSMDRKNGKLVDSDSIRSIAKAHLYNSYTKDGNMMPLSSIEWGPNKDNSKVDSLTSGTPNPNASSTLYYDPVSGYPVSIDSSSKESDLTKSGLQQTPSPSSILTSTSVTSLGTNEVVNVVAPAAETDNFYSSLAKQASQVAIRGRKKDISLRRAYPTFKIYFIDEDEEQGTSRFRAYDDFYGVNSVQEIKIIRSRKIAADLAILRLTNINGELLTKRFERNEEVMLSEEKIGEHVSDILAETESENPFNKMMLQPGVKTQIRLGYNNDVSELETVFLGQITEVMPSEDGNILEIVCQGYGAELEAGECGDIEDPIVAYSAQSALSAAIIQPYITHFGRWNINQSYNPAEVRSYISGGMGYDSFNIGNTLLGATGGLITTGVSVARSTTTKQALTTLHQEKLRKYTFLNDPQDDNIYAPPISTYVDAWDTFWNNAAKYRPFISTPWEIFKEHELRHPGYVSLAVPYGHSGRMTMFFGTKGQNYWKSPPSNKEIALSSIWTKELQNITYLNRSEIFSSANTRNKLNKLQKTNPKLYQAIMQGIIGFGGEKSIGFYLGRIFGRYIPFRDYHMFTSEHHILKNEIRTNSMGTYNTVEIRYSVEEDIAEEEGEEVVKLTKGVESGSDGVYTLKLNDNIPDNLVRKYVEAYPSCITEYMAQRYAQGLMIRGLKDVYRGELIVIGDETIKPYNICMLQDNINKMYGPCEVEQVVHIFNRDVGFISIITPDLCVDFNDFTSKGILDSIMQTTSLLWALSSNTTLAAAQKAIKMSDSVSSKFIGAFSPIMGMALMMHFDQSGSPFIITPLHLDGKPMLGLSLAPKFGNWFQNLFGDWIQWTEDFAEGWAAGDFTESVISISKDLEEWTLGLFGAGRPEF